MSQIKKRSEILFCYDIQDSNPNGDPLDENKPRIDEETKSNIVTDVRLKRTIRDYLFTYEGYNGQGKNEKDIFVRSTVSEKGGLKDGKARAKDFLEKKDTVLQKCIDIRLFGGVIPLEKKKKEKNKENTDEVNEDRGNENSITFTGPVQFQMGRSLHRVEMKHVKGTGAFASQEGKAQNTFRDEYLLPYSFICFHGIINEFAAEETHLQSEDIALMLKALWLGTKNLISRSKFGQMPRLLIKIDYEQNGFFIGELNKLIKLQSDLMDEKIRDVTEFKLNLDLFKAALEQNQAKIDKVHYLADDRLLFNIPLEKILPGKMQRLTI
jgi:CRISPR-associated protein Csh2